MGAVTFHYLCLEVLTMVINAFVLGQNILPTMSHASDLAAERSILNFLYYDMMLSQDPKKSLLQQGANCYMLSHICMVEK